MSQLFQKRVIKCSHKGLNEQEAVASLKCSDKFHPDFEILSTNQLKDGTWLATILEPKLASPPFPPNNDNEESDGPEKSPEAPDQEDSDDSPMGDSGDESSPVPEKKGPPKEKSDKEGEKGEISEVLGLLHQLVQALIPGPGPMPGGGPTPPGPPMGGLPPGAPHIQEVIHKRSLKPGEAPPGGTPMGAPAFASISNLRALAANSEELFAYASGNNTSLAAAHADLNKQINPLGFRVHQLAREDKSNRIIAKLASL
jgi:hypothetical protein